VNFNSFVPGAIHEDGEPRFYGNVEQWEALQIPESFLRVIPHYKMGQKYSWNSGFASPPHPNANKLAWLVGVSFGTVIMTQTTSLPILSFATGGRMTPFRLWRLMMHQGCSVPHSSYRLEGIDYGEIPTEQSHAPPIPMLSTTDLIALEGLGDVDLIKKDIIHRGKFWVWMRPDR
jgi:hypothetical protein